MSATGSSSACGSSSAVDVAAGGVRSEFTPEQVAQFQQNGWCVTHGLIPEELRQAMLAATRQGLEHETSPVEFEAELNYPGAPESLDDRGGRTIRRLKQAHTRGEAFTRCLTLPELVQRLHQLLGAEVYCPLAHHNCIMTKQPRYSSDTGWHQDIRYWSFPQPELISVWIALGQENEQNGCLRVISGSHRLPVRRDQLDADLFLREDLAENSELIQSRQNVLLEPGDVLFFHARTFHSASRNYGEEPKFSVVFTFRGADNRPLPGTRSSSLPELLLPPALSRQETTES